MGKTNCYIEHDGKQLKSLQELKNWYTSTVEKKQKKNPKFNETEFAHNERRLVINLLNEFITTDIESAFFKNTIYNYLVSFLYSKGETITYTKASEDDLFKLYKDWFHQQYDLIKNDNLKENFLQSLIDIYQEIIGSIYSYNQSEINSDVVSLALRSFINYLKVTISTYQHTAIASGHEKLVNEHQVFYSYGIPVKDKKLLLAERLENRLLLEGVAYKKILIENSPSMQLDKDYFKKFIPGTLNNFFIKSIFESIETLSHIEIYKYLSLSYDQFIIYNPEIRKKEFNTNFFRAFWKNSNEKILIEHEEDFVKSLHDEFAKHYYLFVETVKEKLDDFKNGIIKAQPPSIVDEDSIGNFFEKIKEGALTKLEIYNRVEQITNNFDTTKLKFLSDDFDLYFENAKMQKERSFDTETFNELFSDFLAKNEDIPREKISFTIQTPTGPKKTDPWDRFNMEAILFPEYFNLCYQFQNFLNSEINNRKDISKNNSNSENSFKENENRSSNRKLTKIIPPSFKIETHFTKYIEAVYNKLKDEKLISNSFSLNHFKKIFSGEDVTTKIKWTGTNEELCFFIKQIAKNDIVKSIYRTKWDIACKCFRDANGNIINKVQLSKAANPKDPSVIVSVLHQFNIPASSFR